MRLGYLVPEFPSQTHAFFWREAEALRELGLHVQLLSTRAPDPRACRHAFAERARAQTRYLFPPTRASAYEGLHTWRSAPSAARYVAGLSHASVKDFAKQLGLAVCALELVAVSRELGLEHVHIHSAADAAHLGALSRAWGGPPYSLTLHGDLDVYGTNHPQKMKGASFVAAVTRPLQEQVLRATGLPPAAVPLIWMGVDTERFSPAPLDWSAPLRLLTVARLNRQKGHTYALQAVKKCLSQGIDLTYTIVGSGDHQSAIEREVEQLGLQGVVKLTGTLSEDEVLQLLRSSHVFLLPSIGLGEAAPVSVMEAMSCGRAVVCSRIGGTPDMIRDGVDGYLVEQADVDGLTAALMRLSREPSTAEAICSAARQRALEQFDHRTLAGHLAREIANARRAR